MALCKTQILQRRSDQFLAAVETVDAGGELDVLLDRQVLVEREALSHVAGLALDGGGVGDDVEAERGAVAAVRGEQAAEHAKRRRLARTVGARSEEHTSELQTLMRISYADF